ncbi:hypothetical protein POJ06DRAFT_245445 [Lipomyces tetrasporus]|uniref:Secreted protein n=1 Tax=Lipomyces tetrasporus TaxID=54092 RepID=A0AAD7QWE7_9ASCO|nr:uncharacterized protein POJ06DRAFT_245445 [Lipomyces tetrasporus]KAJ8102718.1 hypothetical protein POJ06DRAFT_245445 [Lipomyces tetrasporus]
MRGLVSYSLYVFCLCLARNGARAQEPEISPVAVVHLISGSASRWFSRLGSRIATGFRRSFLLAFYRWCVPVSLVLTATHRT